MDNELKDYLERILLNQAAIMSCLSRFGESLPAKDILRDAFNETIAILEKHNSI